jgi:RNA polymerase sigma-70 factor (ECF subfamily)
MSSLPEAAPLAADIWLANFHDGTPEAMGVFYRDHFATVDAAVGGILQGADRETVVQDVFARLMSDRRLRLAFQGGRLTAWLRTLSRNLAVDFARHRTFERPDGLVPGQERADTHEVLERRVEANVLIERFRRNCLPPKWSAVFEARFVRQMDQAAAARHVGINRTTLAYQEYRIRSLLRRFALRGAEP